MTTPKATEQASSFTPGQPSPAPRRIATLGVVGAGAMGAGIAALAASAGVPVVLLDIPGDAKDRGAPARQGLERARKAKPAAFLDAGRAAIVRTGNTEDDLALLGACDWIIEAIIEQPGPKRALFERLEGVMKPGAIVTSNTSGIPMSVLLEGRSAAFRKHFFGTHFFNPPRYMHLLELIPTPETDPAAYEAVSTFSDRILGKGLVRAKDAPGFIANRLGVFGMVRTMWLVEEFGLTIDEADTLTGPLIGRPNSATFRTGDLSGLDVIAHVAQGLTQTTGEDYALPAWVQRMIDAKQFGDKTGVGSYRKVGKVIETRDWKTGNYAPQQKLETPEIKALLKLPLAERLRGAVQLPGAHGAFLRKLLATVSHYALERTPELAYDVTAVDRAMEWGYGWEAGPFRVMDMLGLDWLRAQLKEHGLAEPALLRQVQGSFYKDAADGEQALSLDGGYASAAAVPGRLELAKLARRGRVLEENAGARLVDLGDGVACLEFRSKMNTISHAVLEMVARSLDRVSRDGLHGLVIGNDDPRTFAAGADLSMVVQGVGEGRWKEIEEMVSRFQGATMSIRRAPFPVVLAPAGLTLGGGCEFALHADRLQAHAETYMGLVEVGVGLLPGGGGTKELLFRFTEELLPYGEADPFEAVKRAFQMIATAATSTSAHEARSMGFLRREDRITMNRDRLIADAKQRVLDLAPDYVSPPLRTIRALGTEGIGNLHYALWAFREAGQATEHDVRIGNEIAYVLCGGDGPPREVTEQDILDLEREAFLKLLGTKETQARIEAMLKTGKPLRN